MNSPRRTDGKGSGVLTVRNLSKYYNNVKVLDNVSLNVSSGEFLTLLGPSGSGKTTTLKIIAGFIHPEEGSVELDGKDITTSPPYKRNIGMVFQNYALFPHMTAAENIVFPLKIRRLPRSVISSRLQDALELVQLRGLRDRYPRQLSGGQQQRVALARALIFRPRVLLMDEPLAALDKKLREAMQLEVTRISRDVGVSVIYVTHDQDEALAMSDRVAVFNSGLIQQVGTAEELYELPKSLFVAAFVGESTIFRGVFRSDSTAGWLVGNWGQVRVSSSACKTAALRSGERGAVIVRPERLRVEPASNQTAAPETAAVMIGSLAEIVYLGYNRKFIANLDHGIRAIARVPVGVDDSVVWVPGMKVQISWMISHGLLVRDED